MENIRYNVGRNMMLRMVLILEILVGKRYVEILRVGGSEGTKVGVMRVMNCLKKVRGRRAIHQIIWEDESLKSFGD